jgi:hypothetical protein
MEVQKHNKKVLPNNRFEKFFKKTDKKSKTDFFSIFFKPRSWEFLGEGSSKTRLKKSRGKICPALVLFWPSRNQPTTQGPVVLGFVFEYLGDTSEMRLREATRPLRHGACPRALHCSGSGW